MRRVYYWVAILLAALPVIAEAQSPPGWHKVCKDSLQGANVMEALRFLKEQGREIRQQIVVGVIDTGVDTAAVDLKDALWRNEKEILNGKDDDHNGYVDDLHGWNFLGTADASFNMTSAGSEEFREFKRLYPKYKNIVSGKPADAEEYAYYQKMRKKAGIDSYIKFYEYTSVKDKAYRCADSLLATLPQVSKDTLTVGGLMNLPVEGKEWENVFKVLLADIYRSGRSVSWNALFEKHRKDFALMKQRLDGIENDADKRLMMGDDMDNPDDRFYGNNCLQVEGCEHGTFVAGVIAGQGVADASVTGVFPQASVMVIRAVPDGDEYDKDIASAIRYAVDNGAKVINMSLGKYVSPRADMVGWAIDYAARHDVLIVQAAGNNGLNVDSIPVFPMARDAMGKRYPNYIRVGASDVMGRRCAFSNYGVSEVDLFAPGEDVTSVIPGNSYMTAEGTSVAAPVVSGIAAMLRAYFPELTASQVKEILKQSVRPMLTDGKRYSSSGGIVDALAAVKLAIKYRL